MTTTTAPFDATTHNGTITIKSLATGEHRTIDISTRKFGKGDNAERKRVVSLLIGSNNEADYLPFAFASENGIHVWKRYQQSKTHCWLAKALSRPEQYLDRVEFMFEGRCRACDRKLTTPESLQSGIGPVCAEKGEF